MLDQITLWISNLNLLPITIIALLIDNDFFYLIFMLSLAFAIGRTWSERAKLYVILLFSYLIAYAIKLIVAQSRPCDFIASKVACPSSYSFPSEHSTIAFSLTAWVKDRNYWWIFLVLSSFIAFTRVYLAVHSTTDVMAGMVFGTLITLLFIKIFQSIPIRLEERFNELIESVILKIRKTFS